MAIPATKNFEPKKHRFFRGGFLEQSFGIEGRARLWGFAEKFANGLQVHNIAEFGIF
jgi:hypothetical protein